MERFGFSRLLSFTRSTSSGFGFTNPAVTTPGFPGAGDSGEANILNQNLRPGMPGWAGNMAPPPPASFTDTSITSGDWTLPRQPPGNRSLAGTSRPASRPRGGEGRRARSAA